VSRLPEKRANILFRALLYDTYDSQDVVGNWSELLLCRARWINMVGKVVDAIVKGE